VTIEEISRVDSVDLVANPATTSGLYEDEQAALVDQPDLQKLSESCLSAMADCRSILFRPDLPINDKKTRMSAVLATWQAELGTAGTKIKESTDMDLKELKIEQLREERPDLVAILTGTDEHTKLSTELKTVKESLATASKELTALKVKEAESVKLLAISEELKTAGLNAGDKTACSESFLETLKAAADAPARKCLIEDRLSILKLAQRPPIMGTAPLGAITDGVGAVGPGSTVQETLSRLRG